MHSLMSNLANLHSYQGQAPTPGLSIALVTGNVISFCLYGALTVQLYIYHISFPNDSKTWKGTAYAIYLIETIYTAALAYDLTHLVLGPDYNTCFVSLIVPVCGGLVALLTQAVYAHRIRLITQMKYIPLCFVALIAIELVTTVVLIPLHISFFLIALIWAACSLLADLTFAIIMIRTLTKDKILSKQFRRRIVRLLHLTIGCGFLTAGINIATLVASLCSVDATIWCGIVLSKIYANSMMVLVNGRQFQSQNDEYSVGTLHVGTLPTIGTTTTAKSQDERSVKKSFVSGETCEEKCEGKEVV